MTLSHQYVNTVTNSVTNSNSFAVLQGGLALVHEFGGIAAATPPFLSVDSPLSKSAVGSLFDSNVVTTPAPPGLLTSHP